MSPYDRSRPDDSSPLDTVMASVPPRPRPLSTLESGGGAPPSAGTSYGYGSNVLGDGEVHVLDYVRMVYKRRWTALTALLVVVLSVVVYTFTATPVYQARVEI